MLYRHFLVALGALLALVPVGQAQSLDLTKAVIRTAGTLSSREERAVTMLIEEVERRSGVRWRRETANATTAPSIQIGQRTAIQPPAGSTFTESRAEGFNNGIRPGNSQVYVAGNDSRGILFGVGHLLRHLEMRRGSVTLSTSYKAATAPESKLRGHQLGYRPKTNSYDGWSVPMWEQYIRDLIVFGINAVELIPPRSDDDPDSPHFPAPPMETMIAVSKILDDYGLDVWVWYPAMDDDYSDPKTVEFALREWGEVFRKLPRVDAVLVPAGDPGHTPAPILMPFLEKQTANLRKYHPKAQMWLAPQGFQSDSIEFFFETMAKHPAWLTGITYGPQTRISLPELRKRLPADIPIRHYPDIAHSRQAQYPVPDWDYAIAVTSSREPINPRPVDQASIFHTQQKYAMGFITYSEGCNDDVNKAIWSGLGWNQKTPLIEILRDYARYYIGPDFTDDFAHGLLSLEQNWRGLVSSNPGIETTLRQFQEMERRALPSQMLNWRFQQALYRAYYDAYVRRRLLTETAAEQTAMSMLERAISGSIPSNDAMQNAETTLFSTTGDNALRTRVFQLAEALYQSIRMQLSVPLYRGESGRGNTLDTVDAPLNSRNWLRSQFNEIRKLPAEKDRVAQLSKIVNWTDPGPGGYYDDLGREGAQPHLVPGVGFKDDPQFFQTPVAFFITTGQGRSSWWDQMMALYENTLRLRYNDLDSNAKYRVRVVYGAGPLRLQTGTGVEIHGYVEKPFEVLEYDLPSGAIQNGSLTLQWNRTPGGGGPGRGCQVSEVWLVKLR
ncbi:hypothetical protein [Bryobacter aggregatus]|uniref:hypothetical protein n=1 Tax=Bryobacter aggregatus TaxID=360054 RepID=UPI0004E0E9EA|nr:hypothetical protein [Bryobacter aggregatus]